MEIQTLHLKVPSAKQQAFVSASKPYLHRDYSVCRLKLLGIIIQHNKAWTKWLASCRWHIQKYMYFLELINTLSPRPNGPHFPEDIFKCTFLNDNVWILNKISLKFVPKGQINNIPALVQTMAWHQPGDKTLSEPMMVNETRMCCQ